MKKLSILLLFSITYLLTIGCEKDIEDILPPDDSILTDTIRSNSADTASNNIAHLPPPPPPPPPPPEPLEEEIFKVVEQMPRFPGCEDLEADNRTKKACADEKMLQFVYEELKYPQAAIDNKTEGTIVVQFVVEKDGTLSNKKVVREIGDGAGAEGLRILELMPIWLPGQQRGHIVRVQFNLPIKFRL